MRQNAKHSLSNNIEDAKDLRAIFNNTPYGTGCLALES